jgi:HSP20 family protein
MMRTVQGSQIRFERRIPIDDVDQDEVGASFNKGVLTVALPKSRAAQQR